MTFVLVGKSVRIALPVLQAVRSLGNHRCVVAGDAETRGLRWSSLCARHLAISFDEEDDHDEEAVRLINGIADDHPQALLIPFDCDGVRLLNRIASRLRLGWYPVPDLRTMEMLADKWRFHGFCREHELPVPETAWVGTKDDLDFDALEAQLGLPFVVKPIGCSGSLGVCIVRVPDDLRRAIVDNPAYDHGPLIAQRYIEGIDMCVNLLAHHGQLRAVSIQRRGRSWVEFVPNAALEEIAVKISRDSRYHGVMNLDVRVEKGTGAAYLLESNPRMWASLAATVACGLNFIGAGIAPAQAGEAPRRLASGRFYTRHPLLRPASWWQAVSDRGPLGRLQRARLFDPYSLGQFAREVPQMAARSAGRVRLALRRGIVPGAQGEQTPVA